MAYAYIICFFFSLKLILHELSRKLLHTCEHYPIITTYPVDYVILNITIIVVNHKDPAQRIVKAARAYPEDCYPNGASLLFRIRTRGYGVTVMFFFFLFFFFFFQWMQSRPWCTYKIFAWDMNRKALPLKWKCYMCMFYFASFQFI